MDRHAHPHSHKPARGLWRRLDAEFVPDTGTSTVNIGSALYLVARRRAAPDEILGKRSVDRWGTGLRVEFRVSVTLLRSAGKGGCTNGCGTDTLNELATS